jgi:hypothetical protein
VYDQLAPKTKGWAREASNEAPTESATVLLIFSKFLDTPNVEVSAVAAISKPPVHADEGSRQSKSESDEIVGPAVIPCLFGCWCKLTL